MLGGWCVPACLEDGNEWKKEERASKVLPAPGARKKKEKKRKGKKKKRKERSHLRCQGQGQGERRATRASLLLTVCSWQDVAASLEPHGNLIGLWSGRTPVGWRAPACQEDTNEREEEGRGQAEEKTAACQLRKKKKERKEAVYVVRVRAGKAGRGARAWP